jgi:two-component system sensor kinase FixL
MRGLLEKNELTTQPDDVNELVREVFGLVSGEAKTRSVTLSLESTPNPAHVAGDRVHLQQVLMNLVLNAFEAMAAVPEDERHLVLRTASGPGQNVTISVSDTGPGLSADEMPAVFEPFRTAKPGGLGLGLSITRRIVEAHEGKVSARNNPVSGATFLVSLPVIAEMDA